MDALALADVASRRSLPAFRGGRVEFQRKADGSAVTDVDRDVEAAIRTRLRRWHPEHGVLGEEGEDERADAEVAWVLDPIDGTNSFLAGIPQWGTLIAVLERGEPVVGVIDVPALGERWCAAGSSPARHRRARGAWTRCRTSGCRSLASARVCLPDPTGFAHAQASAASRLAQRTALVRHGGDCHAYALVASGTVDLVVEAGLAPHDVLAPVRVVENAGGVISDWSGDPLRLGMRGDVVAAATPELHAQALELLRGTAGRRRRGLSE